MSELNYKFSLAIKELRQKKGLSQEDLAELAFLDRTHISFIERNKRGMTVESLGRIIPHLVEDPKDFFTYCFGRNSLNVENIDVAARETSAESKKPQILIVEDEALVAEVLKSILSKLDCDPIGPASTAMAALDLATQYQPDLILMDINLKGSSDGIEAARVIQSLLGTPVVFLTAFSDDETLERIQSCRSYGYILKPYTESQIKVAIASAMAAIQKEPRFEPVEEAQSPYFFKTIELLAQKNINTLISANITQDPNLKEKYFHRIKFCNQVTYMLLSHRGAQPVSQFMCSHFFQKCRDLLVQFEKMFSVQIESKGFELNTVIESRENELKTAFLLIMLDIYQSIELNSAPQNIRFEIHPQPSGGVRVLISYQNSDSKSGLAAPEFLQSLWRKLQIVPIESRTGDLHEIQIILKNTK